MNTPNTPPSNRPAPPRAAHAAYDDALEMEVSAASPIRLVCMLYEGALTSITRARTLIAAGNLQFDQIAEKGKAISKAIGIIEEGLRASLDKQAGGEIAENLDSLYRYMLMRLLEANLHNDITKLDEVHRLLLDLKSAWDGLARKQAGEGAGVQETTATADGAVDTRKSTSYGRA